MKQKLETHHLLHIAAQIRGIKKGLETYTVNSRRKMRFILVLALLEKCAVEFEGIAKIDE